MEIENPENGKLFKVNGQRLKSFLENFDRQESSEELVDPLYRDVPSAESFSYPFRYSFLFLFLHFFKLYFFSLIFGFFIKKSLTLM